MPPSSPLSTAPRNLRLRAYRGAIYRIGEATGRIGRRSRGLDAALAALGAGQGVIVSAWNPMSRRLSAACNRRRAALLRRLVRGPVGKGKGHGPAGEGGWFEEHLLIPGPPRRALGLARRFRQAAVVWLRRGRPARLVLLAG